MLPFFIPFVMGCAILNGLNEIGMYKMPEPKVRLPKLPWKESVPDCDVGHFYLSSEDI